MLDVTTPLPPPQVLQRIHGAAEVSLGPGGRLQDLYQRGSAKAILPKMHARAPEVVFLNTSGGVTGGDRLSYRLDLADGVQAVGTTQTAERAYRARTGTGLIETRLRLGAGACLHWLPQDMILFDGAALDRRLVVEMPSDATLVMLETLVLGRAAMGETLTDIHLTDRREVICDGRPAMIEAIRLGPDDLRDGSAAGLNGAIALASLTLMAPDAEDRLQAVRDALPSGGAVRCAVSALDGRLTARFTAPEAYPLRRAVAALLPSLTRAPLPRVWQI